MTRNGLPIRDASIHDPVDAGISYNMHYAEWKSAERLGLDLWKWETGEYPRWFKAKVVAFAGLRDTEEAHKSDAQNMAAKQAARRKGRR